MVIARGSREGKVKSCYLTDTEFVLQDKKSSVDPLHNNVNIFNTTNLYI